MANQYTMQDPTTQYPKLDIPEQRQDEPGLDTNLQPKADHGEETYEGHNRLSGRKALITGADSGIGAAVAIAFARPSWSWCSWCKRTKHWLQTNQVSILLTTGPTNPRRLINIVNIGDYPLTSR